MLENCPKDVETVAAYKARLRHTALRPSSETVTGAVRAIPKRMRAVVGAKGYSIKND